MRKRTRFYMLILFAVAMLLPGTMWGQEPVTLTTDENGNGTIEAVEKNLYLIQTLAFQSFYMAPQANNTVTTNNIMGDYLLWYFLDAGTANDTQYYYIVNNSTGQYIYNHNGNSRGISLISSAEFASLSAANKEKCKFKLVVDNSNGTTGFYNIDVRANQTYYGLNKQNGSQANTYPIRLTNNDYIHDGNSKWKFIPYSGTFTWPDPPFTVSTDFDKHYYKIHNLQNTSYYVSTDATPDKVTFASTESNNMVWYLKEAGSDTWYKYYYLVNPEADKYMYYNGTAIDGSDQTNAVSVRTYDSGDDDRYRFVVVQAARGDAASSVECYAIIPKLLNDKYWSSNSIGPKGTIVDGLNMGIISSRSASNTAQWQFVTTVFSTTCEAPVITYSSATGKITITTTTLGSTIYYTTDGSTPSSSNGTAYSSPLDISEPGTIKAIVTKAGFQNSEVTTKNLTQVATPTIQNNGANAISITCATAGATIHYTTDGNTPTTSSTTYTGPLRENVSGVTIKAIAVKEDMINSTVASGSVTLQCEKPIIVNVGGTVTISCSFPSSGVAIYYTNNGDTPTSSSTLYSGSISVTTGDVIKAIAVATGYNNSEVAEKIIRDDLTPDGVGVYHINSDEDFETFVDMVNAAGGGYHYVLGANVNASTPITNTFSGIFDGGSYTISGLTQPLFETLTGTVKNLVLKDVAISAHSGNTGAIACEASGSARIYNVGIISGEVGGTAYTGGIVGLLDGEARVVNCYSYADITGGTDVGGIVGYNNVATTSSNIKTMVFACMFYGNITGGSSKAPVYNGTIISNVDASGVGNFNYFRLEAPYVQPTGVAYNCALGAEDRFLQRFEFYRHLLNSQRELAGWWATGSYSKGEMYKWVLHPDSIGTSHPYPILRPFGKYPSVVNYDAEHAESFSSDPETRKTQRNQGRKFGTLTVNIQMGSGAVYGPPVGAAITTSQLTINITDKDPDHYNFNYYKVQLPYYNDVATNNYHKASDGYSRVVTGWKIVGITGGTAGSFTTGADAPAYNFADRNCTDKDLYSVSGRIFNQGAYWDVPEGVTAITIEPYWARCTFLADAYADVVYNATMDTKYDVPSVGGGQIYTNGNNYTIAGESQVVYTSMGNAIASSGTALFSGVDANSHTVYDYAVVLVDNYHHLNSMEASNSKPYTVTSIDLDGDNEPDYSYILRFNNRTLIHPVRVDFINIPGLGMAQKSTGSTGSYNFGILQPKGWFESTNTSLFRVTQFEYDAARAAAPTIVQGGVFEQWVGGQNTAHANNLTYFHVGGNVWFKEFHRGCHQDKTWTTKHPPVSVTGGDYDEFYLTGLYRGDVNNYADNAECYINGGRFGIVCGAAQEGLGKANGADNTGNITWQIQNADIDEFHAGGLNAAKPVTGNLSTTITGGYIGIYCGGPKFGDMSANKTVTTTATGCTFGTFFGAGYGGNSYSRYAPNNRNWVINIPGKSTDNKTYNSWNSWVTAEYTQSYSGTYGGVSTQFNYQFLPMSDNESNVARLFVEFVKFSLATTHEVTSTLNNCTIIGNFYGGGSLGKVDSTVTSVLDSCTVNGDVYGAGYSASLPTVEVDSIGFRTEPYYYENLGTYRTGVKGETTTYTWEHANAIGIDKTNHILKTTEDLTTLGSVSGDITLTLTLKGTTVVAGDVFGGGEESSVTGDISVILQGKTHVLGNVYGGGKEGPVTGNVSVTIEE